MNTSPGVLLVKRWFSNVDWKLLIFLVLVFNVKLVVKFAVVVVFLILQRNLKMGFRVKDSRLPLFYPLAIVIAVLNLLLFKIDQPQYLPAFITGIVLWLVMIAGIHIVKTFIENNQTGVIEKTLSVFFVINSIVSIATLGYIIIDAGSLNPYTYQGEFQKYFISTGDYIKGISFDTSTTNAVISAAGAVFFFTKKKSFLFFTCVVTMILTGSNMVNLIFAGCLLFLFLFRSTRPQKSIIIVSLLMIVVFLVKISPQNNQYLTSAAARMFGKEKHEKLQLGQPTGDVADADPETVKIKTAKAYLDSMNRLLLADMQSQQRNRPVSNAALTWQAKPELPIADIHSASYQHVDDTASRKELISMASTLPVSIKEDKSRLPGKILALRETVKYLQEDPGYLLTGTGMGNFSSKVAFKTTGLNIAGSFPERYIHIDPAFATNHLPLYLSFFADKAGYHSIINSPHSVYDQVLAEYGIAGSFGLVFLYFGFFVKKFRSLSYGLPLLLMLAGLFFLDYWFEQLSIVFLFELLLFLDMKGGKKYA